MVHSNFKKENEEGVFNRYAEEIFRKMTDIANLGDRGELKNRF